MTCDELFGLMLDFVSGELVVETCESIKLHIASCERCDIIVSSYKHTMRVARALPRCDLSTEFKDRLRKLLGPDLSGDTA